MGMRQEAYHGIAQKPAATTTGESAHHVSWLAVLLLALALLALSALFHAAAAARIGGGWRSLGAVWLVALGVIFLALLLVRSSSVACRWMCFIDGVASLGVATAGAVNFTGSTYAPDVTPPPGPVLGFAVASSILVIAGLVLAALFFAAWHLLSRHQTGSGQHA